jgi:hypothetical protein
LAVPVPVLLLTGAVGVAKTTVSYELRLRLREADVSHVLIDDEFGLVYPHPAHDPLGEDLRTQALGALWAVYQRGGVERVVIARTIEDAAALQRVEHAIPNAQLQVYWLVAPLETIYERIEGKGVPSARTWCEQRAAELVDGWERAPLDASRVETDGRTPPEVAAEIAERSGWLPT